MSNQARLSACSIRPDIPEPLSSHPTPLSNLPSAHSAPLSFHFIPSHSAPRAARPSHARAHTPTQRTYPTDTPTAIALLLPSGLGLGWAQGGSCGPRRPWLRPRPAVRALGAPTPGHIRMPTAQRFARMGPAQHHWHDTRPRPQQHALHTHRSTLAPAGGIGARRTAPRVRAGSTG
jgi:hypothetical protein